MKYFTSYKSLFNITIFLFFLSFCGVFAQTPGYIYDPIPGSGPKVLDPNGDRYVSKNLNSFIGFQGNDQSDSEIPYTPIVFPANEPDSDLGPGPDCRFTDFVQQQVGVQDAAQNYRNPLTNEWLFRLRLGGTAPNSKSYSLLIDTDQKFGNSGPNPDSDYREGNPGFEIEIVLATNFGVYVYNVNGAVPVLIKSYLGHTNYQKSIALSTECGNPDYFYDFFVDIDDITGMTASTPVRMALIDNMAAQASSVVQTSSRSDLGGSDCTSNFDNCYTEIIDNYSPCPVGVICPDRSLCPIIDGPIYTDNTTITGTSTEASGTNITVNIYASDGTTLVRSGTTTTSGSTWSLNTSSFSPSGALVAGQIVNVTATAVGKGTSIGNCSPRTILAANVPCSVPAITNLTLTNGNKVVNFNYSTSGNVITVYDADTNLAWSGTNNGLTTTSATSYTIGQTAGSNTAPANFYLVATNGGCSSAKVFYCATTFFNNSNDNSSINRRKYKYFRNLW